MTTHPPNIRYLTGFSGDDSLLVATRTSYTVITDGRYTEEAELALRTLREERVPCRVVSRKKGFPEALSKRFRSSVIAGVEEERVSHAFWKRLRQALPKGSRLKDATGTVENIRRTKSAAETTAVRKAVRIAENAFLRFREVLSPGMSEIEAARLLEDLMASLGAESPSFPTIVASGPNSSKPHHKPGKRKIRKNDIILVDWGARASGYCSDLTRVLFTGTIRPAWKSVYDAVLEAHRAAASSARDGIAVKEMEKAAHGLLGRRFSSKGILHALGHGIGLEIHETPSLSSKADGEMKTGDVFTIEPGYYRSGAFGIRLEDDYFINRSGRAIRISRLPQDMAWAVLK